MFHGMDAKPNLKMKSSKSQHQQRKEAGTSFFKTDTGAFFRQEKAPQKVKKSTGYFDESGKPNKAMMSRPGKQQPPLDATTRFDTRDRLVSSVQQYMALFCSLGDAGMSLSTSVHSVLSEIGFTEIAGQFSRGFNEINEISMATFDDVKDFVEKVVETWEAQKESKNLNTKV